MQVQINSDQSVDVDEKVLSDAKSQVNDAMDRYSSRLTRVELHLSDVDGQRSGSREMRCLFEARPAGLDPVVVTEQAPTVEQAIQGAARKMQRLLSSLFGRRRDRGEQ